MGLAAPLQLKGRLLFQQATNEGLKLDTPVNEDVEEEWREFRREHMKGALMKIPRHIRGLRAGNKVRLVVFSDASTQAVAALVYAVVEKGKHPSEVSLLSTKVKVAPQKAKKQSLPRLELVAAAAGAMLLPDIRTGLAGSEIVSETHFVDSACVLAWVKATGPLRPYEASRVKQLRVNGRDPLDIRFIEGLKNPADVGTRPIKFSKLLESEYQAGPDFLQEPFKCWPDKDPNDEETPAATIQAFLAPSNPTVQFSFAKEPELGALLKKIAAKACTNHRQRTTFSVEDRRNALKEGIRTAQRESFPKEVEYLIDPKGPRPGRVKQLGV
jgi:hypothetical protein